MKSFQHQINKDEKTLSNDDVVPPAVAKGQRLAFSRGGGGVKR